jgi:hypothetical protein
MTSCRVRIQLAEALGPVNRWYCSQACGAEIHDPERLLSYFVKNGGARDFAKRFNEAMGSENRWYCSEFYGRDIRDADVLWEYFLTYGAGNSRRAAERCLLQEA